MTVYPKSTPQTPIIEQGTAIQPWAEQPTYTPVPMFQADSVQKRMFFTLGLAGIVMLGLIYFAFSLHPSSVEQTNAPVANAPVVAMADGGGTGDAAAILSPSNPSNPATSSRLSPVFTPEIHYWADHIVRWADQHKIGDPNLVAIVMQIESCGYQDARSSAGATGLFQVMPFHFDAGENHYDPETNAYRGMLFLSQLLSQTSEVGLAFAGYNGGPSVMTRNWNSWPNETQRYYRWATGIYEDIQAGGDSSPTLQQWLDVGGRSLCQQAATRQLQANNTN